MASDIWLRPILIVRKETRCHHIGYSFWLTARVLLHAPSYRQDSTYHSLCYTSRRALAGTRVYKSTLLLSNDYQTEELAKVGTCARDRRALQQLALNVHIKHSYLLPTIKWCTQSRLTDGTQYHNSCISNSADSKFIKVTLNYQKNWPKTSKTASILN